MLSLLRTKEVKEETTKVEESARQCLEEYQQITTKLNAVLDKVRFFPGSQAEYEAQVGYPVRVIDTGLRDMGVEVTGIIRTGISDSEPVAAPNGMKAEFMGYPLPEYQKTSPVTMLTQTQYSGYSFSGSFDLRKHLVDQGIEAIVNASMRNRPSLTGLDNEWLIIYGLPVAKK